MVAEGDTAVADAEVLEGAGIHTETAGAEADKAAADKGPGEAGEVEAVEGAEALRSAEHELVTEVPESSAVAVAAERS